MPKFNPDSIGSIRDIFSLEGDALARAGFAEPAEARVPADDTRPSARVMTGFGLQGATLEAYERSLSTTLDERAYE